MRSESQEWWPRIGEVDGTTYSFKVLWIDVSLPDDALHLLLYIGEVPN